MRAAAVASKRKPGAVVRGRENVRARVRESAGWQVVVDSAGLACVRQRPPHRVLLRNAALRPGGGGGVETRVWPGESRYHGTVTQNEIVDIIACLFVDAVVCANSSVNPGVHLRTG